MLHGFSREELVVTDLAFRFLVLACCVVSALAHAIELPRRPLSPYQIFNPGIWEDVPEDSESHIGFSIGPTLQSNPGFLPDSAPPSKADLGVNIALEGASATKLASGRIGIDYAGSYEGFPEDEVSSFSQHDFDLVYRIPVGTAQTMAFRPFGTYMGWQNTSYFGLLGFAVSGMFKAETSSHSLQAAFYEDHFFQDSLADRQGFHIRFDYRWDFSIDDLYLRAMFYLEHNKTGRERLVPNGTLNFSHNDLGVRFSADWNRRWGVLSCLTMLILREDVLTSSYAVNGIGMNKRREDFQIVFRPNVAIPITSRLQLTAWAEINRNFSNFGVGDFEDDNAVNWSTGLSLRAYFSGV